MGSGSTWWVFITLNEKTWEAKVLDRWLDQPYPAQAKRDRSETHCTDTTFQTSQVLVGRRGGAESLRPAEVQAEPQGQPLPQLHQSWPELFCADVGVPLAGAGGAHALLPFTGGERALGWRRGCAGSWGSLGPADFAGAAGMPWPGSEQPQVHSLVHHHCSP